MLELNFTPFPVLETERLLLRRVGIGDVDAIYAMRSNPETMKYIPRPLITTIDEAADHIAMIDAKIESNDGINWAITLKGSPILVGIIGHYRIKQEHFRAEIGYMLHHDFQGQGIASEAIKKVVEYGFRMMNLHSIEAIIDPENYASGRVLEKNGFIKEAHLRENEYFEGRFLDTVIYSILNEEPISASANS